jgi:hypothetical protein
LKRRVTFPSHRCGETYFKDLETSVVSLTRKGDIADDEMPGRRLLCVLRRLGATVALSIVAGTVSCVAGVGGASATDERSDFPASADRLAFSIPSQSLETALMAYARTTGVEVFVDHALVAGRQSGTVQGVYSLETALRRLLEGTGLDIRQAATHAYTLVAVPEPPPDRVPGWSADQAQSRFFTALQAALRQSLCAQPEVAPGLYRKALAVWIDSTGRVTEARLLSDTADTLRSPRLVDGIKGVAIGQPPPSGLEQPVTIIILPRPPATTGDCGSPTADH